MESAHSLAVVCRAKQITREAGAQVEPPSEQKKGQGEDEGDAPPSIDHAVLVKAIEIMARKVASSLADKTPPCQVAKFQLEVETLFRQQQRQIAGESQDRVDRIQAKMNQILKAKRARVTVQEMNRVYDQATGSSEGRALTAALEASLSLDTSSLLKRCEDEIHSITRNLMCYTGCVERLSESDVRGECLLWFQARTYMQQLHAATATSISLLDKLARELLDMVAEVQSMVKEMKAVPKQTILPMFYRIGQHFEATLDEQRQAMVHQVMLDSLQQQLAAFSHRVPDAAGHGTNQLPTVTALATSGDTQTLQLHELGQTGENAADAQTSFSVVPGRRDLAWGGADIVVFVRHQGMLLAASDTPSFVQYPEGTGSW